MARDTDPAASARRILVRGALLLVPIVASAIAMPHLLGRVAPEVAGRRVSGGDPRPPEEDAKSAAKAARKLADAQRGWLDARTIAPADGRVDPLGESVRWFQGFGVSVESEPPAATVLVNGAEVGTTPLVASVRCAPGDQVVVEVRKARHAPHRQVTTCRADTLVELTAQLRH